MASSLAEGVRRRIRRSLTIKRRLATNAAAAIVAVVVPLGSSTVAAAPDGTVVQTYTRVPEFPVDMAWVPGTKTIFYTEKDTGKIRIVRRGNLLTEPCRNLAVDNDGERGALGIVLDPAYEKNHYLYVYFSSDPANDNRIARFTVVKDKCTEMDVIFEGIPDNLNHNGGQLEFMGGKLFVTTGDAGTPSNAQDLESLAGKVLRLNPDGTAPDDNPYDAPLGHPAVWSYGHRNGFGLATRGTTGQLFQTDNGPGCDDELNKIEGGSDYGWKSGYNCSLGGGMPPLREWTPTIAPTDLVWYRGPIDALDRKLLMSNYNDGDIHSFALNGAGTEIVGQSIIHDTGANLMDVAKGPGGWVYYLTPGAIKRIRNEP